MNIAVLGLSITSSWGNGHATTYRGLLGALAERGHTVRFFERDVPWYRSHRDLAESPQWQTIVYENLPALQAWTPVIRQADAVIVGSYVPEGPQVIDWVLDTAPGVRGFYDIDTPVTLSALENGGCEYIRADQVTAFDVYLSFTGGPILASLARDYGVRLARPLYCAVDPTHYHPRAVPERWDLGYLGTYSADRQPALDLRLIAPARQWRAGRFVVAGPQFPPELAWPANVERISHVPPPAHPAFYSAQRYSLNVTRAAMVRAGHAPSVRLFEAAACGVPVISDCWEGLDTFFEPDSEILVTRTAEETLDYLRGLGEDERRTIAARARARVLGAHTARHRAAEFERHLDEAHR